ncbi:MAG: hypothetical protein RSC74_01010 [Hydrogenoanaerobacterium sp.]
MKKRKFMQAYEKQQPVHPPPQAASEENKIYASLRKATAGSPTAAGGE